MSNGPSRDSDDGTPSSRQPLDLSGSRLNTQQPLDSQRPQIASAPGRGHTNDGLSRGNAASSQNADPSLASQVTRPFKQFYESLIPAVKAILDPNTVTKPDLSNLPPRPPAKDGEIDIEQLYPDNPGIAKVNPFPMGGIVSVFAITGFIQGILLNKKRQIAAFRVRSLNSPSTSMSQHGLPEYRERFRLDKRQSAIAGSKQALKFGTSAALFWGVDAFAFKNWGFSPWNKAFAGAISGALLGATQGRIRGAAAGAFFFGVMGMSLGYTEKGLYYAEAVLVSNHLKRLELKGKGPANDANKTPANNEFPFQSTSPNAPVVTESSRTRVETSAMPTAPSAEAALAYDDPLSDQSSTHK